jgi:hypothetical protein
MAVKPILFSGQMVRAILDGRKAQTRMVIKPQPEPYGDSKAWIHPLIEDEPQFAYHLENALIGFAPYQPGDILWVRETWREWHEIDADCGCGGDYCTCSNTTPPTPACYRADGHTIGLEDREEYGLKWRPPSHMPKWACRLFLRVTNVRVERVQDISEEDARAEGVDLKNGIGQLCPRSAFRRLWDSINAKRGYGWGVNPWVWVYEFERTGKPEAR